MTVTDTARTRSAPAGQDGIHEHDLPAAKHVRRLQDGSAGSASTKDHPEVARRDRLQRWGLVVADAAATLLAIVLTVTVLGDDQLRLAAFGAAPLAVALSKLIGLYDRDELLMRKSTLEEAPAIFQLATMYALVFFLLDDKLIDGSLGKSQVLLLWAAFFAATLVGRFVARGLVRRRATVERCLVVGDLQAATTMSARLRTAADVRSTIVAQVPLDFGTDRLEVMATLREAIKRYDAHRVVVAPGTADSEDVLDAIRLTKSLGRRVSLLPRLFEVVGSSVVFDELDGLTVLGVRRFGLTRSSAAVKRGMDLVASGLGLLAFAPIFPDHRGRRAAHECRPRLLPADPRRAGRPPVRDAQVPLDGRGRGVHEGRASRPERGGRALQDRAGPASGGCCGRPRSTNCRSS